LLLNATQPWSIIEPIVFAPCFKPWPCLLPAPPRLTFLARSTSSLVQKRYVHKYVTDNHDNVFQAPTQPQKDLTPQKEINNRAFAYFMVGSYSILGMATAKNLVSDFLVNLAASADVLAMAKVEVDLSAIPEGKNVVLKWRGKPVVIRHRTSDEIQEANQGKQGIFFYL
jgi:ubiquinol-cytochrome c reductase iron-sulfur subunit